MTNKQVSRGSLTVLAGILLCTASVSLLAAADMNLPALAGSLGRRMRAHIIGVAVSETASETITAIDSVMPNSRKKRPTRPPMRMIGMKTARLSV